MFSNIYKITRLDEIFFYFILKKTKKQSLVYFYLNINLLRALLLIFQKKIKKKSFTDNILEKIKITWYLTE